MSLPEKLENVTITLKANVYFNGEVVSHTLVSPDGRRETVGMIRTGQYHFNTDSPERMDILSGNCRVRLNGETEWKAYQAGSSFQVPGKSSFDIASDSGLVEYLCRFESV